MQENNSNQQQPSTLQKQQQQQYHHGCKHYKKNCKIQSPCCQQWFFCRLCHDEHIEQQLINKMQDKRKTSSSSFDFQSIFMEQEEQVSLNINDTINCDIQKMDRFDIQYIYCIFCNHIQKPSQYCQNCNAIFGIYFCKICNLFDNNIDIPKYHCNKCGICVRGIQEEMFHCNNCDICLPKSVENTHKCIKDALDRECPICIENLKYSTKKCVSFKTCGHWIHEDCFKQFIKDNVNKCPICSQAIRKQTQESIQAMDEIYNSALQNLESNQANLNEVSIICSECSQISYQVPETFTGLYKCSFEICGTYNTKLVQN